MSVSGSSVSVLSTGTSASTKLSTAQAQLQACEAHLAELEKSLDERRLIVIREGLSVRCRAMVECGWSWGEMGKEGLRALEDMAGGGDAERHSSANGNALFPFPHTPPSSSSHHNSYSPSKPLPAFSRADDGGLPRSSDLSLSPSQSAPNIFLPAAHKIDDHLVSTSSQVCTKYVLAHRISELTEPDSDARAAQDGSSEEDAHRELRGVENDPFANTHGQRVIRAKKKKHLLGPSLRKSNPGREEVPSPYGPSEKERRRPGFFGSIRGLFKGWEKDGGSDDELDVVRPYASEVPSPARPPPYSVQRLHSSEVGLERDRKGSWKWRDRDGGEIPGGLESARRKTLRRSVRGDPGDTGGEQGKGKRVEEWVEQQSKEHLPAHTNRKEQTKRNTRSRLLCSLLISCSTTLLQSLAMDPLPDSWWGTRGELSRIHFTPISIFAGLLLRDS